MAVSGSTDFLLTRAEIIEAMLRKCGVLQAGESPESYQTVAASQALNVLTKAWANSSIGLWKNKIITLFLSAKGTQSYFLPGAYASTDPVLTEVATAQTSGNNTLVLDSITGMADGNNVGIELDDGTMQWTTINGAPAAITITLTDNLTDDVAVGNDVYVYSSSTAITRPIEIIEARICLKNSPPDEANEIVMSDMTRIEYMSLSNKRTQDTPTSYYYDPQTLAGVFYVWPTTNSVAQRIVMTTRIPVDDFDNNNDDADYPQQYLQALIDNGAYSLAPQFGITGQRLSELRIDAISSKQDAMGFDVEHGSTFLG